MRLFFVLYIHNFLLERKLIDEIFDEGTLPPKIMVRNSFGWKKNSCRFLMTAASFSKAKNIEIRLNYFVTKGIIYEHHIRQKVPNIFSIIYIFSFL